MTSVAVTICRRCGWYSSLGTFVELDAAWETELQESDAPAAAPQKSHVRVWLDLLPRWSWIIIASVFAVVIESIAARLATPAGSWIRTTWSLSQLALGVILATGCHVFNFLVLAADDADFGVLDLFLRPLKLWLRAAHNLPKRLWVANSATCGIAAVFMSIVVIGGLPYERLWDWGFQEPVKQNLMGAVMDRAKQLESGDQDLEDAIGDFAGKAGVEEDGQKAKPEKPREKTDCVILGYNVDRDGRLSTLVLATAHRNRLLYVGQVAPEMSEVERTELLNALAEIKTRDPFIAVEATATWVQPKFACRISFGERLKGGRLRDLKWEKLLGTMRDH
jgi:hypothetical protein